MQTIGDLIDQLITTNTKLFWNQQSILDGSYKGMDKEELLRLVDVSDSLNCQRSILIDEINGKLAKIVSGEEKVIEFSKHKTGK